MTLPPGKVTQGVAIAIAVAFLLTWLGGFQQYLSLAGGFIPARVTGMVELGGAVPVWLTPLTAAFIHAGLLHLGFNLLMLVIAGRHVESVVGGGASLLIFVAGAYAAALLHWSIDPTEAVPMVGASGAISATVGAYAVFFGRDQMRAIGPLSGHALRIIWLASGWIFLQSLVGIAAMGGVRVAIFAHIGGFIAGLALARPLLLWRYRRA